MAVFSLLKWGKYPDRGQMKLDFNNRETMTENFDQTYQQLFRTHHANLIFYATRLVGEEEAADVVQDVFVELWKRKDTLVVGEYIRAFLYQSVYNRSLNVLKHRDVKNSYESVQMEIHNKRMEYYHPEHDEVVKKIENQELRRELLQAINDLPDQCRRVFKMSYLNQMKNKEISELLGISLRTVEAHMYKALKMLRDRLGYLKLMWIFFLSTEVSVFVKAVVLFS